MTNEERWKKEFEKDYAHALTVRADWDEATKRDFRNRWLGYLTACQAREREIEALREELASANRILKALGGGE
jgi:ribosomal protein S17E